jgi:glycosyltransferase involved in cell wall biosynthesis
MNETPELSIVVPVHDNGSTLAAQLTALVSSTDDDVEIVVVDNRSTDTSRAVAERWAAKCARVRVVDAVDRASEGYARNVGVAASRSERIAFCDGDDLVAPTWAAAMRRALSGADFVTGPVELDLLNPDWLASVRGRRLFASMPMLFDTIPFAHGCNFGIRRSVVTRAGRFQEDMRAGMDIDFSIALWKAGIRLVWDPLAIVHYRLRVRTSERWRQSVAYGKAQPALRALVPDVVDSKIALRQSLRRAAWLVRTTPFLFRRADRARWLWTLGLVVGEAAATINRWRGER